MKIINFYKCNDTLKIKKKLLRLDLVFFFFFEKNFLLITLIFFFIIKIHSIEKFKYKSI